MDYEVKDVPVGTWYWHIHHMLLVEPTIESLTNRVGFIRKNKPEKEIVVRLERMQPVSGTLPDKVVKAGHAYIEASKSRVKALDAYIENDDYSTDVAWNTYKKVKQTYVVALDAYIEVLGSNLEEIEKLHLKECPNCPWDGKTLFPEKE